MSNEGLELKFNKLDKRHTGHETFKYYVTVNKKVHSYRFKNSYVDFFKLRDLCTETWGTSCERDLYIRSEHENPGLIINNHWAWHVDLNNNLYRIYLKSDEEKTWLLLKW